MNLEQEIFNYLVDHGYRKRDFKFKTDGNHLTLFVREANHRKLQIIQERFKEVKVKRW